MELKKVKNINIKAISLFIIIFICIALTVYYFLQQSSASINPYVMDGGITKDSRNPGIVILNIHFHRNDYSPFTAYLSCGIKNTNYLFKKEGSPRTDYSISTTIPYNGFNSGNGLTCIGTVYSPHQDIVKMYFPG